MSFFRKLIKNLLSIEADTDAILEGRCPECGEPMDEEDTYDGPDCFLCATCREGEHEDVH